VIGNSDSSDYGPVEKLSHGEFKLEPVDPKTFATRLRRVDVTPFDTMLFKGIISDLQHSASESLCLDLWQARMLGPSGSNFDRSIGGDGRWASARQADRFHAVIDALRCVSSQAGKASERWLLKVAIDLVMPSSKKEVGAVKAGLSELIKHYEKRFTSYRLPSSMRLAS
tara:strand:- start:973 stop:1479 length:507 start_codon:yes stop_codon:yes gene_type:complete